MVSSQRADDGSSAAQSLEIQQQLALLQNSVPLTLNNPHTSLSRVFFGALSSVKSLMNEIAACLLKTPQMDWNSGHCVSEQEQTLCTTYDKVRLNIH